MDRMLLTLWIWLHVGMNVIWNVQNVFAGSDRLHLFNAQTMVRDLSDISWQWDHAAT